MKKILMFFLLSAVFLSFSFPLAADTVLTADPLSDAEKLAEVIATPSLNLSGKSCVLIEAETGLILYESNKDEKLPPASVTKVMTMLLILEAVENGNITMEDSVTASEHAASMGGTQIYLEVGESMTVHELFKAVAVPSANDAAVALAEYIAGTEDEFVRRMNVRAAELGMKNTNFTNCTGLFDDENHYTSAYDLALATKELYKHKKVFEYTTIWMDSLRNGTFGLANTNKMLRTYQGMTGMKTGYTRLSGHCLSGTAERNGMTLIAVVLGSPTSSERFSDVSSMLDYGFATFSVVKKEVEEIPPISVKKGKVEFVEVAQSEGFTAVVSKGKEKTVESILEISEFLNAPVLENTEVGTVTYLIDGEIVSIVPIYTKTTVEAANIGDYFVWIMNEMLN